LANWLKERDTYDRIKDLEFFNYSGNGKPWICGKEMSQEIKVRLIKANLGKSYSF
jgi:hypothetical protein